MMETNITKRYLELAAQATNERSRLHFLMHAAIRPGLTAFVRDHVLKHGGPTRTELPDIYMSVFASLSAELIENYILNTGESRQARRALIKFMKERFAVQLDNSLKSRVQIFDKLQRPDS